MSKYMLYVEPKNKTFLVTLFSKVNSWDVSKNDIKEFVSELKRAFPELKVINK